VKIETQTGGSVTRPYERGSSVAIRVGVAAVAWLVTSTALAHAAEVQRVLPSAPEYFPLGVEHILMGFDHLLFLAALVLGGGRVRDVLYVVTTFTLAHSVTLALGVLGLVHPNALAVEVLIALSIAGAARRATRSRSASA
jgi:hydrogenase/urease accessory protein HupE